MRIHATEYADAKKIGSHLLKRRAQFSVENVKQPEAPIHWGWYFTFGDHLSLDDIPGRFTMAERQPA